MPFQKGHKLNIGNQYARGVKHSQEWKEQASLRMVGNSIALGAKPNKTSYKKGHRANPFTEFKKGDKPWNKGKRHLVGESNPAWKGDGVGYPALHAWIRRILGSADRCSFDPSHTSGRFHWANVSGNYERSIEDWIPLCPTCHKKYDKREVHMPSELFERKNSQYYGRKQI